ncbi:MAG: methionyl-tRNA formyltransferase [Candidatus Borkfalkiaceae bacterium]|nr:methionyl-tRNA formyltransferase [Clostridia bacterium]MDY6223301.1 methionyl-tRNA formyltransferase [Christensenellaceae bacterium]
MKILFAGTPQFAVEPLKALTEAGDVAGVITQEDKLQGRKKILTPSPVKAYALSCGLPVFQPKKIREEVAALKNIGADMLITCAYGQILTQEVLDCFPRGVWNIHAGLLPAYRGASPVQSCILNGETETGVCVMKTALALDEGDILLCETTKIGADETAGELSARLSVSAAELIQKAVPLLESGEYTLTPQNEEGARIYRKITREQAKIDFSCSARQVVNKVRAMNPEPVAYALLNGAPVNFYRAQAVEEDTLSAEEKSAQAGEILSDKPKAGLIIRCKTGAIKALSVQPAGGKVMTGGDFLSGRKGRKGQVFE